MQTNLRLSGMLDVKFLTQGCKLLFKMPEGGLQRLTAVRMRCRGKFLHDAAAGKLKTSTLTEALAFVRSQTGRG